MNSRLLLPVLLSAWLSVAAVAAADSAVAVPSAALPPVAPAKPEPLVRFSVKFPGGTPQELRLAIAQASGKPCNLIVAPTVNTRIPPLELANVTVPELFNALRESSTAIERTAEGNCIRVIPCNFHTASAPVTDQSIWYLSLDEQTALAQSARICRFYSLAHYLKDYTIDDITTALVTAWGLDGVEKPNMTFHKETNLLIVVGNIERHSTISQALMELSMHPPERKPDAKPSPPAQPKNNAGK
jgi:hypothetical protein